MITRWFYAKGDQTHGPIPAEELKALAAAGLLRPDGWIWPEGSERTEGTLAGAAVDFARLPGTPPVPEWLEDVAQLATRAAPRPPSRPSVSDGVRGCAQ